MTEKQSTILCIVRDRKLARPIAKDLGGHGFKVILAHQSRSGMAAVTRELPDLVLADIDMPEVSGFEIRDRVVSIARRFRNLPFIFIITRADRELKARRLDGEHYVVRPLDFDILRATIRFRLARVKRSPHSSGSTELSRREVEMLTWSARGRTSAEIAQMLGLSKRTVDVHLDRAKAKLGAANRIEAAVIAATKQLIKP